jgi:protease-4
MTLEADQIVDRRRMRRRLAFWRVVAFLAIAAVIIIAVGFTTGRDSLTQLAVPQIARISIDGFVAENRAQTDLIDRLAKTDAVKAVIVSIDSTGGSTAGGEALYESLRKLAQAKPTVATVGTFGASAAYMAAIATDHIVVRRSSITGSIGVLFQYPEVSKLLDTLGIKVEEIKSAPLKAEPSPFKPASDEAKAVIDGVIHDTYDWFVDIVAERRGLDHDEALRLSDGRIYSGRQAVEDKLADEIGGEEQAIAWLAKEKGVNGKLPVKDWKPAGGGGIFSLSDAALLWISEKTGLSPLLFRAGIIERFLPASLKLDGLVSVWQAPSGVDDSSAKGAEE